MRQIVCLSTSNWHPFPTRKQQVMGRLNSARILYFDPPVSYLAPLKDPKAADRLKAHKQEGEPITKNLTVYGQPPLLPFYQKHRLLNRLSQRRTGRHVRNVMSQFGFEAPVLWTYSPFSVDAVPHIPHKALVYDCVDRHSAYGGLMDPALVDNMERELASQAQVVFATAKGLYDRLRTYNPNTYLVPNGVNFDLFNTAATEDLPFPDDLFNIQNPILGFVGMLQEALDYPLLESVARMHPEWSFVLLGKPWPGVRLESLKAYKNIHFLGLKPHKVLPQYLARFDVCLNFFKPNALSEDVSPLKFYEYLATGKPIVSTPQPAQVLDYADVAYIAAQPEAFAECCRRALTERSAWHKRQRIEYAKLASWDNRVAEMTRILKEKGIF